MKRTGKCVMDTLVTILPPTQVMRNLKILIFHLTRLFKIL
jgi:hypothetical protein